MNPPYPTPADRIRRILARQSPGRIVYAPNYWQWFTHHQRHGLLPDELRGCASQLEVIRHLGLDVFSRNLYCDATAAWFGGLAEETWDGIEVDLQRHTEGRDIVIAKTYRTPAGVLTERLRHVFAESTLVQEKHLITDFAAEQEAFLHLVRARRWRFHPGRWQQWQQKVGDAGLVVAGELYSPLKLLHFAAGAADAVFMLLDHPEACADIMAAHEQAQLDLVRQMVAAGVPAMMSMDNLDSMFHTPQYLERCSGRFYEQASQLCHQGGATFWIHACGRQKAILPLVASLGVDGLEGVAYPPLGDTPLDEAFRLAGDRLLLTGGISAMETEKFQSAAEVHRYVQDLCARLRPYTHRFMLSASCNTSIRTPWTVLQWFRDAWLEHGQTL